MFNNSITICVRDTDVTGVLYFTEQLRMAQQTLELYLSKAGFSLKKLFEQDFFVPIVHAESDYLAPIFVGDILEIRMSLLEKKTTSFQLGFQLYVNETVVGTAQIVHVVVDRKTRQKTPIPPELGTYLDKLAPAWRELCEKA